MPGKTSVAPRTAARAVRSAIALPFLLLLAVCAPAVSASASPAPSPSGSPGPEVYEQPVLVHRKDGSFEWIKLYSVRHKETGEFVIIDSQGKDYEDLDDFRANNDLFTEEDKITIPRNFPTPSGGKDLQLITVPGHTSNAGTWWLAGGIAVAVLVSIGVIVAVRGRGESRSYDAWLAGLPDDRREQSQDGDQTRTDS
ncbi:hypothetical protein ACFMQL_36135 [Nonomuraea fastidiosa]|jgi:hypothetical protein|uniref:hypothetical protein n=1 Tax=Nonomuraea TaxID=83681 RepID=UPI003246C973